MDSLYARPKVRLRRADGRDELAARGRIVEGGYPVTGAAVLAFEQELVEFLEMDHRVRG